jgi:hypothetical protein
MGAAHPEVSAPLVTLVTVAYNARRFIRQAISSILAQDFTDFELLVCDDCSTDDTWEMICEFSDPRIRAVRHASNTGEYANRNQALADARGKYIVYIDGDDYLYPHGLGHMVRTMERFPRAAFASAQEDSERFIYPVELSPREIMSCLLLGPDVFAANFTQIIFRTSSLRDAGGFDRRFRSGDTYIQVALAMQQHCVLIAGGLAWWRRHPGNASDVWLSNGRACAEMVRYAGEFVVRPECPLSAAERSRARQLMCARMLRRVLRHLISFNLSDAFELLRVAGARLAEWRYLFSAQHRPYLSDVSSANPIRQWILTPTSPPALTAGVHKMRRRAALPYSGHAAVHDESRGEQLRA